MCRIAPILEPTRIARGGRHNRVQSSSSCQRRPLRWHTMASLNIEGAHQAVTKVVVPLGALLQVIECRRQIITQAISSHICEILSQIGTALAILANGLSLILGVKMLHHVSLVQSDDRRLAPY